MGNKITHNSTKTKAIKVILPDGKFYVYDDHDHDKPVTVAELMMEHPQHVVVEFDSRLNQNRRTVPLAADRTLDVNKVYMVVPMKRGGSNYKVASLGSGQTRSVLLRANSVLNSPSLVPNSSFFCLFARMCYAGDTNEHNFVSQNKENVERSGVREKLLAADFSENGSEFSSLSRQFSAKGTWRPSLDTIEEKRIEKKIPHWIVFNGKARRLIGK